MACYIAIVKRTFKRLETKNSSVSGKPLNIVSFFKFCYTRGVMVDQRFSVSVHIMTAVAFHKLEACTSAPALVTSDYLASSIRTNPTVVRRLVAKLTQAGLLKSYKGKSGGVELAKPAQSISLKDIYVACSGKKLINASEKAPKKQCKVSCSMGMLMGDVIEGFENNSMKYLSGIVLADLLTKIGPEK
jgi:Rrf2 family protein